MNMIRWYIKENQKLVSQGKPPLEGIRYKVKRQSRYSRAQSRRDAAINRHEGGTPHERGKRRPRNWHQAKRAARKRQKAARRGK